MENFNSIKVRLKPKSDPRTSRFFGFQFHKGTIKTLLTHLVDSLRGLFQFHKGTIKT